MPNPKLPSSKELNESVERQLKGQTPPRSEDMTQVLAFAAESAEYHLANAEAQVAEVSAQLKRADSFIAALRALAIRAGLHLSNALEESHPNPRFLSRLELATRMGVSIRRVDQHRERMVEGVHYHKDGARVLFHYPEAVDLILSLLSPKTENPGSCDIEQLTANEIARRRTRRRTKSSGDAGR